MYVFYIICYVSISRLLYWLSLNNLDDWLIFQLCQQLSTIVCDSGIVIDKLFRAYDLMDRKSILRILF